jgi:hypothetical protein
MGSELSERARSIFGALFDHDFGNRTIIGSTPTVSGIVCRHLNVDRGHLVTAGIGRLRELVLQACHESAIQRNFLTAILVVDADFVHFERASISNAKVACISVASAFDHEKAIKRILRLTETSNYVRQLNDENSLLDFLEMTNCIIFRDCETKAEAVFNHSNLSHWFSLNGPLKFGDQTVLPTGELSVLNSASGTFDCGRRLDITGRLALGGGALVHCGSSDVSPRETRQLFEELAPLRDAKVLADVANGWIDRITPFTHRSKSVVEAFNKLFSHDPRYRLVHEVGFGTNMYAQPLWHDNSVCDERYPCVHFGIGLGGVTRFHIDLLCPYLSIVGRRGAADFPFPLTITEIGGCSGH